MALMGGNLHRSPWLGLICIVEGCGRPQYTAASELCQEHWGRAKDGQPETPLPEVPAPPTDVPDWENRAGNDLVKLRYDYEARGMSVADLARRENEHLSWIYRRLQWSGAQIRSRGTHSPRRAAELLEIGIEIRQKYEAGTPVTALQEAYGFSGQKVRKLIKRAGGTLGLSTHNRIKSSQEGDP